MMLITSNMTVPSLQVNSSLSDVGMTTYFDGGGDLINSSSWVTSTAQVAALSTGSPSTKTPFDVTSGLAPHTDKFVTMKNGAAAIETTTLRMTEEIMNIGNSRLTVLTVYLTVAFSIVLFVMLFMWICCRGHERFRQIAVSREQLYEYIYSPLHRTDQDDEYENTYVGISIPLLQDNTKV